MFTTKYTYVQELITRNPPNLKHFEDLLQKHSPRVYELYTLRFKERFSFEEISNTLNIPNRRISELLQSLDLALKIFFDSALDDLI